MVVVGRASLRGQSGMSLGCRCQTLKIGWSNLAIQKIIIGYFDFRSNIFILSIKELRFILHDIHTDDTHSLSDGDCDYDNDDTLDADV